MAVSLATAALLCCTLFPAFPQPAAAREEPAVTETATASTEPLRVLVTLRSPSLLEQFGKDALGTPETAPAAAQMEAQQKAVLDQIRALYPEAEAGAYCNVLLNGFTCTVPEAYLDPIRALPEVESVQRLPEILIPEMSGAAALSGLPAFAAETGCTGEGQVIAVIDSELSTDHPMFSALPDTVETRIGKEDVAACIAGGALHLELDPDQAYRSSKLPYAVDYVDTDPYGGVEDPGQYHGTHVTGIAAGKPFVSKNGRTISGIAPDAQILFMAVGGGGGYIDGEAALLAIEDAIALHADVINMSWGSFIENYQDNLFAQVFDAADKAGVSICTSAGNSDNGSSSLRRNNYPESPDVSTIDDKTETGRRAFVVASADNQISYRRGVLRFAGEDIVYLPSLNRSGRLSYLTDLLPMGDYAYIDYAEFTSEDLLSAENADLSGKLLLVRHSLLPPEAIARAAGERSAIGVLLADAAADEGGSGIFCPDPDVPVAFISPAAAAQLAGAQSKIVQNPGAETEVDAQTKMSFYSSWGTGHSLDLRPDITGIGGSVESAAYEGGTEIMSGTSMASPYVAGCCAVVRQYLHEQGIEAEGLELTDIVRRMLMNSAVPYTEHNLFVTPRRQGAGLVSLENLMQTKAILTGPEHDAKVNLYDRIGDSFDFEVTLTNLSDEDVTFSDAQLRLTTDDTTVNDSGLTIISGQRPLDCTADLSPLTSIAAGESRTVLLHAALDHAQTAGISAAFVNGFFIDGFLLLSEADNCADISIPVCGYYGDWAELPVYSTDSLLCTSHLGPCLANVTMPLRESIPLIDRILDRAPAEERAEAVSIPDLYRLLYRYATQEEQKLFECGNGDVWISPNGDTLYDVLDSISFEIRRQAMAHYTIKDADGNVLYEGEKALLPPLNDPQVAPRARPIVTLPLNADEMRFAEGDYRVRTEMWIDYPDARSHPQVLELPFHVDTTAPEMYCEVIYKDDRKYLQIQATDNGEMDCAFIVANCADPSRRQEGLNDLQRLVLFNAMRGSNTHPYFDTPAQPLPYVCEQFIPQALRDEELLYDYAEMLPVYLNAYGAYQTEYDITGLTNVSVVLMDKAWNFAAYDAPGGAEMTLKEGVWLDAGKGLMEFYGNTVRFVNFFDGAVSTWNYTLQDHILTLTSPGETLTRKLYFKKTTHALYGEEGTDSYGELLYWPQVRTLEEFPFHTINECTPLLCAIYETRTGKHVTSCTPSIFTPTQMNFWLTTQEDGDQAQIYANVNLVNGICNCQGLGQFNILTKPAAAVDPGIYVCEEEGFYLVFREDGCSGQFLVYETNQWAGLYEFVNPEFTYTQDESGNTVFVIDGEEIPGYISAGEEGMIEVFLESAGNFRLTRTETPLQDAGQFRSSTRLLELVIRYHEAVTGKPADLYTSDGITDEGGSFWFEGGTQYRIDPFTLVCKDEKGRSIDLMHPPVLPEDAYSLEDLSEMALHDFEKKTGRTDCDVKAKIAPDGCVELSFVNPDEADDFVHYTVDPVTCTGTDQDGSPVNLPETGNQDPGTAALTVTALLLLAGGLILCTAARRKADPGSVPVIL